MSRRPTSFKAQSAYLRQLRQAKAEYQRLVAEREAAASAPPPAPAPAPPAPTPTPATPWASRISMAEAVRRILLARRDRDAEAERATWAMLAPADHRAVRAALPRRTRPGLPT